jgi:hypothetical protein
MIEGEPFDPPNARRGEETERLLPRAWYYFYEKTV